MSPKVRLLAVIRHLRRSGAGSVIGGTSFSGILAGFLDASGTTLPLIAYVGIALTASLIISAFSAIRYPRYRFAFANLPVVRQALPSDLVRLQGEEIDRLPIIAGANIDSYYYGGFSTIANEAETLLVVAAPRRDVANLADQPEGMFGHTVGTVRGRLDPGHWGIAAPPVEFDRALADSNEDLDFAVAMRDLVYVPDLVRALQRHVPLRSPALMPEHCVDPLLLATNNVVVIGGPDTNFWHAALFEAVREGYENPASTVPLAFDTSEPAPGPGMRRYGSVGLKHRIAAHVTSHAPEVAHGALHERAQPTYGMLMLVENPWARASGHSRWVLFLAGTRSIGTAGALLATTCILDRLADGDLEDVTTAIETTSPGTYAEVSAALIRAVEVEEPCRVAGGRLISPRNVRPIPSDRPDPLYRDGMVPSAVELLNPADAGQVWMRLHRRQPGAETDGRG